MQIPHIVEVNELPADKLCNYIESKHYHLIEQLMVSLDAYLQDMHNSSEDAAKVTNIEVLYFRIKDEILQLLRNDKLIIFPIIRNDKGLKPCGGRKLPLDMIKNMNKKIMSLLEKMRHMVNNYLVQGDWSQNYKIACDALYNLEQQVMQCIYLKENVLLPKVEKKFNQPCGGNCKHL